MNSLDNSELITSEVAPGYWLRYGYGGEQCEVLYRRSYAILSGMIEKSHYKALGYSEVYYCGEGYSEEKMREQLVDEQLGTLKSGWMLVNGAKMVFKQFRTIKVDMRRFLAELVEDCVRRRIKIEQKEFGSRKEVENVEQRVVFNCAGYGGGRLF